jgi:hypothetical protein
MQPIRKWIFWAVSLCLATLASQGFAFAQTPGTASGRAKLTLATPNSPATGCDSPYCPSSIGIHQSQAQPLTRKSHFSAANDPVVLNNLQGDPGVAAKYGFDPHFVYNSYPWHAPAMYSGFRHYQVPPPVEAHDIRPYLLTPEEPETAPVPRKMP